MSKIKQALAIWMLALFLLPLPSFATPESEVFRYLQALKGRGVARQYAGLIVASAHRYGLNPMLIASVIRVESDFDSREVSTAGARGLMQVMPCHFENRGIPRSRWFDPKTNLDLGCRIYAYYQRMMQNRYPGLPVEALRHRTLVAYNMGPRAVVSRGIYRSRYSQVILNYTRKAQERP